MSLRYLFGPASKDYALNHLQPFREEGNCLAFNATGDLDLAIRPDDTWASISERFPRMWKPDFIVLHLPYEFIPEGILEAPLPIYGLAPDWKLLWHYYRDRVEDLEAFFTDSEGIQAFHNARFLHARSIYFNGCGRNNIDCVPADSMRDIDLLVVGNLNPAVHPRRAAYLTHLARTACAWKVEFHPTMCPDQRKELLRRSRIVFCQVDPGDSDSLVWEATASGTLVLQNHDAPPIPEPLRSRAACIPFTEDNWQSILQTFLIDETYRREIVRTAQTQGPTYLFEEGWREVISQIESEWPIYLLRRPPWETRTKKDRLRLRSAQLLCTDARSDSALIRDLEEYLKENPKAGDLHNSLGLAILRQDPSGNIQFALAEMASDHFRNAIQWEPDNPLFQLNYFEAMCLSGKGEQVALEIRKALGEIDIDTNQPDSRLNGSPARFDFGYFRIAWEKSGWEHADNALQETRAKLRLIRWQMQLLLSQITGDVVHHYEALIARLDLVPSTASLGNKLATNGHLEDARYYLCQTLERNPFDRDSARVLFEILMKLNQEQVARSFARDRRLLSQAIPNQIPDETWFIEAKPTDDELVSIIILCCNQLEVTRLCLDSLLRFTRPPYELILVDNGSTDGTFDYLQTITREPGPARIEIVRNKENVGFPKGCNQGYARSRGRFLLFLNNDIVLTEGWLDGLLQTILFAWPHAGLVGPVTNYAPDPQGIPIDYEQLDDLAEFANRRKKEFANQILSSKRVTGFCLLTRREVLERIGTFDEQFGIGFFDDDDIGMRIQAAGWQLLIAQDIFIHHFGSQTFRGLGIDTSQLLHENFERFRQKWGESSTQGYRFVRLSPQGVPLPEPIELDTSGFPSTIESIPPTYPVGFSASSGRKRKRISLSMIVRNEEKNLPDCLRSAADLFDEIVIADTGSKDRTREIAREYGATLVEFPWCDSFSAARNASLKAVTGDWVLWLDADDRLDETNRKRFQELFHDLGEEKDAYAMKVRSGLDPNRLSFRLLDQVRLFPKMDDIEWEYRVHEQILPSVRKVGGNVRWVDIIIDHTGYQDASLRQGKLERNLHLLELDHQERPDDAFTLFNLGWTILDLGRTEEAIKHLQASLDRSTADSSITRKLYDLISHAFRSLNRPKKALEWCEAGLQIYPDDGELLLQKALLLREEKDLTSSIQCLERLLDTKQGRYFASVDAGLKGYKSRHLLGELYREQGRRTEAELQWRAGIAENPSFAPSWVALGELMMSQGRWQAAHAAADGLSKIPTEEINCAILRARTWLSQKEYLSARSQIDALIERNPNWIGPRVMLTHLLLQQGGHWSEAEKALREVLRIDPEHQEAKHNLSILFREHPELNQTERIKD